MSFASYIFILIFMPLTVFIKLFLDGRKYYKAADIFLICASFVFCGFYKPVYACVLLVSLVINFLFSRLLLKKSGQKMLLTGAIAVNVLALFYFKYFNFCLSAFAKISGGEFRALDIILPLGISFYTFRQLAYLVDSYRGETKDVSFREYALFISYFPTLIQGPITLQESFIPQLKDLNSRKADYTRLSHGLYLFSVGLLKKTLFADVFGRAVDTAFAYPDLLSSSDVILISLFYTFQLYFDFSGYCDMAEGVSGMMNIKLPHNFDSPYKAVSIEDFWRRWHMTLTGFLRKYIYFPLGGSRRGKIRTYINIMIIFLISGIWHGANYTFIIWGLIHGMLNCFDRLIKKLMPEKQNTLVKCIRVVFTFTAVNFLWLLFRCGSLSQAAMLFGRLFEGRTEGMTAVISSGFNIPEFRIVESFVPFAASMVTKMPALPAYIFLGAAAAVVFVCRNSHETEFKPDVKTALFTIAALFWSVMSFTGISSFIYAGF